MYKKSLYTIFVSPTKPTFKNKYLIIHGYTGAVDLVSKSILNWLRGNPKINPGDLPTNTDINENTIDKLIARGYLTNLSPLEEKEKVSLLAKVFHKRDSYYSNFLFLVAYDCNFRCPYCFENAISCGGKGWSQKVFTKEAVDRAYSAMLEIEPNQDYHRKEITLYGGEPLLKSNIDIVQYIVEEGVKRGYTFNAITNGYELDSFRDLLSPDRINRVQITIDGTKEVHDKRRTHFLNGSTFDKIMENISLALDLGIKVNVRINTDLNNINVLSSLKEVFDHFGFYKNKSFTASSALIHGESEMNCNTIMSSNDDVTQKKSVGESFENPEQYINFNNEQNEWLSNNCEKSLIFFNDESNQVIDKIHTVNRSKYIKKYQQEIEKKPSLEMISCQDYGIRSKLESVLTGKDLITFRSVFCSAQTGMIIFDPDGDLYSCWETVGLDQHKIGRYREGLVIYEDELSNWYGRNISTVPACSRCKYAFFCGGGCQAHAIKEGRGYNAPYCDGYAATFQRIAPDVFKKHLTKKNEMTS